MLLIVLKEFQVVLLIVLKEFQVVLLLVLVAFSSGFFPHIFSHCQNFAYVRLTNVFKIVYFIHFFYTMPNFDPLLKEYAKN